MKIRLRRLSIPAKGSGSPLATRRSSARKFALDPGSVDERRAQNDELDPGLPRPRAAACARSRACRGHRDRWGSGRSVARNGAPGAVASPIALTELTYGPAAARRPSPRRAPAPQPPLPRSLRGGPGRPVGAIGEMDDDLDTVEMPGPVGLRADIADRAKFDARNRFAGRRVRPRTVWPRSTSPRHSARPMKPAAPVTRMRANAACLG